MKNNVSNSATSQKATASRFHSKFIERDITKNITYSHRSTYLDLVIINCIYISYMKGGHLLRTVFRNPVQWSLNLNCVMTDLAPSLSLNFL